MPLLQSRHARLFLSRESGARVVEKLHGRTVRVGEVARGELVERAPQEVHRVAHVSELHVVPVRQWNVGPAEVQVPPCNEMASLAADVSAPPGPAAGEGWSGPAASRKSDADRLAMRLKSRWKPGRRIAADTD